MSLCQRDVLIFFVFAPLFVVICDDNKARERALDFHLFLQLYICVCVCVSVFVRVCELWPAIRFEGHSSLLSAPHSLQGQSVKYPDEIVPVL